MNYDYFSLMESGKLAKGECETEQDFMTRILTDVFSAADAGRINDRLEPAFTSCCAENRTLSVSFVAKDWMLNPNNTLHGGILSTATDIVMCVLGRYLVQKRTIVTAQLSINFLCSVQKNDVFTVHATADHVGRRSIMMHAHITTSSSDKTVATATAVLM